MKDSYTLKEVIIILEGISESLADNIVCIKQAQTDTIEESQGFFNMGQLFGIETADSLVMDTIKDIKQGN